MSADWGSAPLYAPPMTTQSENEVDTKISELSLEFYSQMDRYPYFVALTGFIKQLNFFDLLTMLKMDEPLVHIINKLDRGEIDTSRFDANEFRHESMEDLQAWKSRVMAGEREFLKDVDQFMIQTTIKNGLRDFYVRMKEKTAEINSMEGYQKWSDQMSARMSSRETE